MCLKSAIRVLRLTGEDVLEVLHGGGQLAVLHHGVLHVLQALDGVDALPPVLADVGQRALDVLHVHQGVVQLGQPCAHPVQLGLDGGLERDGRNTRDTIKVSKKVDRTGPQEDRRSGK